MLYQATITEICKHIDNRTTLFNFLNCCKYNQQFDSIYFNRYHIRDSIFGDYLWKLLYDPNCAHGLITFLKKIRNLKSYSSSALETIAKLNTNLHVVDIYFKDQIPKLPISVKKVTVSVRETRTNVENLPDTVEILILPQYDRIIEKLPNSLIHLQLDYIDTSIIRKFPPGLTKLFFAAYWVDTNTIEPNIDNIPDTVEELRLPFHFNYPVTHWPANLKYLDTHGLFKQPLDNLPLGLKTLEIGCGLRSLNNLPSSVDTLIYSMFSRVPLYNLPKTIKRLTLKYISRTDVLEIADTIEIIDMIGDSLAFIKKFPANLKRLNISRRYPQLKDIQKIVDNDKIFFID